MANFATRFYAADYTGGYTSNIVYGHSTDSSNATRGVFQVSITSGSVDLQMRVSDEAPWYTIKTYTASVVEELVLAPQMRVVATANAEAWLAETH